MNNHKPKNVEQKFKDIRRLDKDFFKVNKNVFKLKPAHYIVYNFNGKLEQPQQYWDVDFSRKKIKTEKEWLNELVKLFTSGS